MAGARKSEKTKTAANARFPRVIRNGSVIVKIYRIRHPRTGLLYSVAWHASGRRRLKQFADLSAAEAEARLKAGQLAAGRIESAATSTAELEMLQEARRIVGDVPLLSALEEWKKARAVAGNEIIRACESWAERNAANAPRVISTADAVKEFIAAKRSKGVDVKCSYLRSLPPFEARFASTPLRNLSASMLQVWLDATFKHPVSRNTVRSRIVTLFRWARTQGLLPRDIQTEAERTEFAREEPIDVGLISPERFRALLRLLAEEHSHYLPAAVVAGFCGLRRAEVHRQNWADISLDRRFVRVTYAKKGTPARRLVPLCDAAIEWLIRYRAAAGPICTNLAIDRIRDIARTAGLDLPENGFRNSFISARVALTNDIGKTAIEAGNSTPIIYRHYLELMTSEEAESWFAIRPSDAVDSASHLVDADCG